MSISLPQVNYAANGDTWQTTLDKLNAVINTVANSVVTANTNANGALTTGNGFVNGIFGANTLVVSTLRGGNVQASANMTFASNVYVSGTQWSLGNSTINVVVNSTSFSSGNTFLSGSILQIGNSTANAIINSTALSLSPSSVMTGFALTFGNSTVNAVVNTSGVSVSGAAMPLANNKASVAVDNVLIGNATRINFSGAGAANVSATLDTINSQVNVIVNATVSLGGGAGGTNTTILFNDSGGIGGSSGFTFDKTSNNATIANTLTIGGSSIINASAIAVGNSTVNAVANSTVRAYSNSSMFTIYGLAGWAVGANVQANTSALQLGNSTVNTAINSTSLSTANLFFTGLVAGPNLVIGPAIITLGNSTINAVANSSTLVIGGSGGSVLNAGSLGIGGNVVVNTSTLFIGNTSVSIVGNSSQIQVANATVASITNSTGMFVGSNVSMTFTQVTVGNTIVNSSAVFVGNSSVRTTINSTAFSGTSNNSIFLGGVAAASYLTTAAGVNLTAGFTFTPFNLGTGAGTVTPNALNSNYQYMTNNGGFTLAAPSLDCAIDILVTNGATAGAITFSGFTVGSSTGDPLTLTNGSRFIISIRRINAVAAYTIKALQ